MRENKGITLISLVIYIIGMVAIIAVVGSLLSFYNNNMVKMNDTSDVNMELSKFTARMIAETKEAGNEITDIAGNTIKFKNGNVYTYQDNRIYENTMVVSQYVKDYLTSLEVDGSKQILRIHIVLQKGETEITNNLTYVIEETKGQVAMGPTYIINNAGDISVKAEKDSLIITVGESNDIEQYFTYTTNGNLPMASIKYIDTSNNDTEISNTNSLSVGIHEIKCTVTNAKGDSVSETMTIIVEGMSVLDLYQNKVEDDEGYDPNALHIGDFVTYTTGSSFEQGDGSSPTESFSFGGYTVGQSRDDNARGIIVNPGYSLIKEKNGNTVTGWRIFDITADGSITLISAGCPEEYYHPASENDLAYISEYILTGINQTGKDYSVYASKVRRWEEYRNNKYPTVRATTLTKTKLDEWYSKYQMNGTVSDTYSTDIFRTIYGTKYENLIDNYSYYWLATTGTHYLGLYCVSPYARYVKDDCFKDFIFGIRVLVTLSSETKITGKIGTKTLVDPRNEANGTENSWTYNVWELQTVE